MEKVLSKRVSQQAVDSPRDRLDSWKEIAAYFRRDVRTVRRWERSLGLPVRRHRQQRGVAVYAYRDEVDAWWQRRGEAPPDHSELASKEGDDALRLTQWALSRAPLIAAAVCLAVLALFGWNLWPYGSRSVPAESAAGTWAQLSGDPDIEENASLSPDGRRVAFSWNGAQGGNLDIYVLSLEPSAAAPIRLTRDTAPDSHPTWSPDGRSIAFARQSGPSEFKVMLIPADGGVATEVVTAQITWTGEQGRHLAWTPDGKGLVFLDRPTPREPIGLFLVSLEDRESRRLW